MMRLKYSCGTTGHRRNRQVNSQQVFAAGSTLTCLFLLTDRSLHPTTKAPKGIQPGLSHSSSDPTPHSSHPPPTHLQVVLQRLHTRGLNAQQGVGVLHGSSPCLVAGQHLGKRKAVGSVARPCKALEDGAGQLQHRGGDGRHLCQRGNAGDTPNKGSALWCCCTDTQRNLSLK